MIWDARPFQDSEANLVSNGVSIWRCLAQVVHLGTKSQCLHEQHERWPTYMGGQGHMPIHPLKAWPFGEWWMPAASTGAATSSGAALMTTWNRTTRYLLKGALV